jgi:hypothetical protein
MPTNKAHFRFCPVVMVLQNPPFRARSRRSVPVRDTFRRVRIVPIVCYHRPPSSRLRPRGPMPHSQQTMPVMSSLAQFVQTRSVIDRPLSTLSAVHTLRTDRRRSVASTPDSSDTTAVYRSSNHHHSIGSEARICNPDSA